MLKGMSRVKPKKDLAYARDLSASFDPRTDMPGRRRENEY